MNDNNIVQFNEDLQRIKDRISKMCDEYSDNSNNWNENQKQQFLYLIHYIEELDELYLDENDESLIQTIGLDVDSPIYVHKLIIEVLAI